MLCVKKQIEKNNSNCLVGNKNVLKLTVVLNAIKKYYETVKMLAAAILAIQPSNQKKKPKPKRNKCNWKKLTKILAIFPKKMPLFFMPLFMSDHHFFFSFFTFVNIKYEHRYEFHYCINRTSFSYCKIDAPKSQANTHAHTHNILWNVPLIHVIISNQIKSNLI